MIALNESQRQTILYCFLDIHRRMAELEPAMAQSAIASPFSRYTGDLSPTERKVVQDYFERIRTAMLACLQEADIPLDVQRTSLRWTLQVGMSFLSIAVADMGPERLRGYGPLEPAGQDQAIKMQQDLSRLIDRVATYLRQGLGRDLPERLSRLQAAPANVGTLKILDRVIDRWQLVEFRPTLDQIVRRFEVPQFEIAVFGRVSSGKSSLLNHITGTDVLPIGVTPITAVPTRLVRGDEATAVISFAEGEPRRALVSQLRDYASEEGNPGNRKHVTNIVVQLPAPRLREGVVLVDTPGIGSLALAGSAETIAYLPRCDLGVVLIDAASTLNQDDLGILRALYESGVPAQVLLSKADLLTPADRDRMIGYIQEQLQRELGLSLPVHPVSTVGSDEALLSEWFEHEVAPLFERQRVLTEASLRRKSAHLRESVLAVLETLLAKQRGDKAVGRGSTAAPHARRLLEEADAAIRAAQGRCQDWATDEPALVKIVLHDAAQRIIFIANGEVAHPLPDTLQQVLTARCQLARGFLGDFQRVLGQTLERLRDAAPLANADPSAISNLVFSGLPVLDLAAFQREGNGSRPWWTPLLPQAAAWAVRRSLRKNLEPELHEYIGLYDRQLRAWLKGCLAQLVEAYEFQAEPFREQVRRLTVTGAGSAAVNDLEQLALDLHELQESLLI